MVWLIVLPFRKQVRYGIYAKLSAQIFVLDVSFFGPIEHQKTIFYDREYVMRETIRSKMKMLIIRNINLKHVAVFGLLQ